jgi:hypothetical protein
MIGSSGEWIENYVHCWLIDNPVCIEVQIFAEGGFSVITKTSWHHDCVLTLGRKVLYNGKITENVNVNEGQLVSLCNESSFICVKKIKFKCKCEY